MQGKRSPGRDRECPQADVRKEATNEERDAAIEFAVLALALALHPAQLTLADLKREIVEDPVSFAQADAIERAVRDLVGAGLLHRLGEFAIPTLAALRFDALIDHWGRS